MELELFNIYIIIINIIGFIFSGINILLYKHYHKKLDSLLTIITCLGGTLGILIFILLFDRKFKKENMMLRVFSICMFIIQLLLLILLKEIKEVKISFSVWNIIIKYKILLWYLLIINIITFIVFGLDKLKAISKKYRYKIITLLGLCFLGGGVGGLLGMYVFRHKTKVNYFTKGIPLIILMQLVILIFLANVIN